MIRSPISPEERLKNRVEDVEKRNSDLERRVETLEDTLLVVRKAQRTSEMRLDGFGNRASELEDRVDAQHAILEIFYGLLCGTAHGVVETAKRVDELGAQPTCFVHDVEGLFQYTGS